jgi:hypothetical protein
MEAGEGLQALPQIPLIDETGSSVYGYRRANDALTVIGFGDRTRTPQPLQRDTTDRALTDVEQ